MSFDELLHTAHNPELRWLRQMLVPLPYNRSVGRFAARSAGLFGRVKTSGPIDGRLSRT